MNNLPRVTGLTSIDSITPDILSHILTELQNVADRIAIIKQGRLIKILEVTETAVYAESAVTIINNIMIIIVNFPVNVLFIS